MGFQPLLFSGFTIGAGSAGSSPSIGGTVTGGTDTAVLFIHPGNTLAQDPSNFNYNSTTHALTITGTFGASNFSGSSSGTNTGDQTITLTGDITGSGTGSFSTTLSTVNGNVGSFGSSTSIPTFTVNAKGLITAVSGNVVIAPAGTLSGTTLNSTVINSSLRSLGTQSQALNMGSFQINSLASPVSGTDAATKGYVDAAINGLSWKGPAQAYAISNVPLTGGASLTIDSYSVQNGDLVILSGQTTVSQNGEYAVSGIGTAYTLTPNGLPNLVGDAWLITKGTVYANSAFLATSVVPTAAFTEFAGPTAYNFTPPLSITGNTISISQSTTSTNGYLSSTDWNTFNNKQPAGSYITALTGDVTASGPGSSAATNVGAKDSIFKIYNTADNTKLFKWDLSNQTTGITSTLTPLASQNQIYQIQPNVDTTANILTQNNTSGQVFIGSNTTLGGANSGIQYSNATVANRGQIKLHSYFNGTSVAGVSTLTSRSGVIGTNAAVVAGQDYSKWTAQACATTAGSAPISGTFSFKANTVNSLTVTSDWHLQLTNLAGTLADALYITSEGNLTATGTLAATNFSGSSSGTNTGDQTITLTGDVTGSGTGSFATTLATVNSNVGSFGSSISIPSFTVNGKGLITAASGNPVIAPANTLSGTTLNSTVVTSSLTSLGVQSSALNMGSHQINSVTDPTSAQDAATKNYVDNVAAGINPAVAVQAATTTSSNTSGFTYNNGVSGIGATLTGSTNTPIVIDGFTFTTLGQRLLVKNDTQSPSGAFNGVYYVTQIQTILLPPILTRALDYDQPSDINNTGAIPVINGTVNGTTQWVLTSLVNTVGTDPLTFSIFTRNPGDYLLASKGDISEQSFTAADNQTSAADVTAFTFANATVRSFDATVSIVRNNTYASYKLYGIQKAASWEMSQVFTGDTTGIIFSITNAGQIQYTSTTTGFTSLIKFRAITTSV